MSVHGGGEDSGQPGTRDSRKARKEARVEQDAQLGKEELSGAQHTSPA